MNELPVIGSLGQRGKNCNSLEIWQKVVSTSEKTILESDYRFFPAVLS